MPKQNQLNPEVQKAFQEYERQQKIRLTKIGSGLIILLMPAGTTLDQNVYPAYVHQFLFLRFGCALLGAIVLGLLSVSWGQRYYRALTLILPILPSAFIAWMIYTTEGASSPYYAGLCLVLVSMSLLLPWSFQEIIPVASITFAFYLAASLLHGPILQAGIFFNNTYFLFLTAVVVVIGSYFTYGLRVREFTLRYELDQSRQKLTESNQKLIEMDQVKSRFFANISHELRTPLTLIISPLESLQSKAHLFDQSTRDILKTMQGNALRLLKLINDLLDLVKLESGRMEVRKEPLRMEEFLKGLVLSVQGAALDKRVQIASQVEKNLGTLLMDRDKLEKIVLNLLFNSVKFTPAGGKVELLAAAEGNQFVMRVKDTGMGISEQNLPHIFDRFWQADSSAQRKYQGTGIGLALVKELTEVQGGTVTVESQVGKGTVMTLRFPLEKTTEELSSLEPGATPQPQDASDEWLTKLYRRAELFPSLTPLSETLKFDHYLDKTKRPKLLIADDEPDMLRFLKSQLEKYYEVVESVDGNQALEKARQFLPDLILLDMMMPEKNGIEVCRELRKLVSTQAIPVVLLTARADDETKFAALNAGASDFLTKPFSTAELHLRVKNLIESYQFQKDLARQKNALESTLEQLKETEGQLVQSEKMASLGRLSAGIIHEINNPLNYAHSALHLLKMKKDRIPEDDRAKYLETISDIEEGVGRVQRIVSDLRTFSHPKMEAATDLIELEEVVSTALRFLSYELKNKIKLDVQIPKDQQVLADRNKLIHIFVNLIQNSVDALEGKEPQDEKPEISIKSRQIDGKVLTTIRDNGVGILAENLDKVFDPFFTTKDVGQGMGLGLSICYRILNEQGGGISVKSEQGKFTEFTLELPARS